MWTAQPRKIADLRSAGWLFRGHEQRKTPRSFASAVDGELTADISSLEQWEQFRAANPDLFDSAQIDRFGRDIIAKGCVEPLTGLRIGKVELEESASWREGLTFRGVCSRGRAVLQVIAAVLDEQRIASPSIYLAEAVTPLALRIRGLFPRVLASEFSTDSDTMDELYPIPCEDLQRLTLLSDAFDLVSTNDVLEHVPSIDAALGEVCRVLRPGGWHVGTVPFHFTREVGVRHADLQDDGTIVHHVEPEYHGDPISGRALVFEIAGWDIVARARQAGFSRVFMRFVVSARFGVLAEHVGGVLVLCCQK